MKWDAIIEFPKMKVAVATRDERVSGIKYLPLTVDSLDPGNALAERAVRQIERYREDPDAKFDLPLLIEGTPFQLRLWDALCKIPRGRTLTYGEMARKLGGEDFESARSVGQACGDNRLPIVIPCHRVVAAGGLGGFGHSTDGYLLEAKRWLLMHERSADAFELSP